LQQIEATKKVGTSLTDNERLTFDTFKEATNGNVASGSVSLQEWRPFFNKRHTGDNDKSKATAFSRARTSLVNNGLLKVNNNIYSLGDKAT